MEKKKEPVKDITFHKTHSSFSEEEAADNDMDVLPPPPEEIPVVDNKLNTERKQYASETMKEFDTY